MNGKSIVFIGALAAGAYLLLGGSGAFGGAEGSGSKKATAITGAIVPSDSSTPTTPIAQSIWNPTPTSNQAPFQPSPYLLGLIAQKYAPTDNTVSKKESYDYRTGITSIPVPGGYTSIKDIAAYNASPIKSFYTDPVPSASLSQNQLNLLSQEFAKKGTSYPATGISDPWGTLTGGKSTTAFVANNRTPATPALTSLQQKMGVVLKPSSGSSSSSSKKSSGVRNIAQSGSPGGWGG